MQYFAQFKDVRAVMKAVNNLQSANAVMADAKAKRKTGVGFAAALSDDNYKLDFGITPVGKDGTTVVGGAYFKIPISAYSELRFKGERRAMTDSLLSYLDMKTECLALIGAVLPRTEALLSMPTMMAL